MFYIHFFYSKSLPSSLKKEIGKIVLPVFACMVGVVDTVEAPTIIAVFFRVDEIYGVNMSLVEHPIWNYGQPLQNIICHYIFYTHLEEEFH